MCFIVLFAVFGSSEHFPIINSVSKVAKLIVLSKLFHDFTKINSRIERIGLSTWVRYDTTLIKLLHDVHGLC